MVKKLHRNRTKLPFLFWVILFSSILSFLGRKSFSVMGFGPSGLAWVLPLTFALLILAKDLGRVTFPVKLWMPWILLLGVHLVIVDYGTLDSRVSPIHRTIQTLCPIIVGMAISTLRPSSQLLSMLEKVLLFFSYVFLVMVLMKTGVILTGRLPNVTALAAQVMTAMLFCVYYANRYLVLGEKKDFLMWCCLSTVPVIAVTRAAIAATLLTFPGAFGPMRLRRRLILISLILLLGLGLFYSPRIQHKMFYSGQGELSDILTKDFATSGRSSMWESMYPRALEDLWFGKSTGAGETYVYYLTGKTGYPHNDWLLILYDYGTFGVLVFAFCVFLSARHCLKQLKHCHDDKIRILFLTGASAFIPFMMLMLTDNILVYASYFGNLHFAIMGFAYGALRSYKAGQWGA